MIKTIEQAEAALASANAEYLDELRQDSERADGSDAQERRREQIQHLLRDKVSQCERDLEDAKKRAAAAGGSKSLTEPTREQLAAARARFQEAGDRRGARAVENPYDAAKERSLHDAWEAGRQDGVDAH